MYINPTKLNIKNHYYLIFGVLIAVSFWGIESCVHYFGFGELFELLPSDLNELWMRSAIIILLISFGSYVDRTSRKIINANINSFHLKIVSRAKKQWEAVADTLPQLIICLDHEARIIRVNRTYELWCLGNIQETNGIDLSDLFNQIHITNDNDPWLTNWPDIWQKVKSGELIERKLEIKSNGKTFSYTLKKISDYDHGDNQCFALLVMDDITEQQNAEKALKSHALELERLVNKRTSELRNSNALLKHELHVLSMAKEKLANERLYSMHLLHKLFSSQENERKRIALELHDSIGQSLGAIKFKIEEQLLYKDETMDEDTTRQIDALIDSIKNTMNEVRSISMNLRPSMLDDLGILPTLNWFCREYENTYSTISVRLSLNAEESDITDNIKVTIFRIVQEAMNNVSKYSNATNVLVELNNTNSELTLCIRDNGNGFDANSLVNKFDQDKCIQGSFGLGSMRERAESTNGKFSIDSTPDHGTSIIATWQKQGILSDIVQCSNS